MLEQNTEKRLLDDILNILEKILPCYENQFEKNMNLETLLGADLGMKSIEFVKLLDSIQNLYGKFDLPFEDLFMQDGRNVRDITIADVVDFLKKHLI